GQSTGALRAVSGNLVASGAVSLRGSVTIGADAGSQLTLGGPIDDGKQGFGLTKALPGTLRLAPAAGAGNTYGGATDVAQGILVLAQDGALAGSAATTVAAGAQLQLSGGITATTGPVTLAGTGISGDGALLNLDGDNTLNAPVTLASDVTVGTTAGTLVLGQAISDGGKAFGVTVTGTIRVLGGFTLEFAGTTANTYTGMTTVISGVLALNQSGAAAL